MRKNGRFDTPNVVVCGLTEEKAHNALKQMKVKDEEIAAVNSCDYP